MEKILILNIPFITFLMLFFIAVRKINYRHLVQGEIKIVKNYLPVFTIGIYLLSAFLVNFVNYEKWYPFVRESSLTFSNFTIYAFFLALYLLPVLYFRPITTAQLPKKSKIINITMYVMSFGAWYSIIYLLPIAILTSAMDAKTFRVLHNASGFTFLPANMFSTLALGISYFYIFFILLFFIAIINKHNKFLIISLFLGSISYIISGMCFATRDVFVFYGFGFLFAYLYLGNLLSKQLQKRIRRLMIILGTFIFIGVMIISNERFQSSDQFLRGTVGYIAPQSIIFSEFMESDIPYNGMDRDYPVFASFFGSTKEHIARNTTNAKPVEWNFGTFLQNFYGTGGFVFLLMMTIWIVPLFYIKIRNSKGNVFYRNMIIVAFYFQFISQGIFYFKMSNRAGNLYMIVLFFIYIFTHFIFKRIKKD